MKRASLWVVILVLAMLPVGLRCVEGEKNESEITVRNGTPYYIHVDLGGNSFPYLGPGKSTGIVKFPIRETITITVVYSPGEPVSGSLTLECYTGGYSTNGLGCDNGGLTCNPVYTYHGTSQTISITEELFHQDEEDDDPNGGGEE